MRPVSKGLFLGGMIGSCGFAFLALVAAVLLFNFWSDPSLRPPDHIVLASFLGLAFLVLCCLILAIVLQIVVIYKMWAAIQDGRTRTTPGMAVTCLLIPFFNIYWFFPVYYGWCV